MEEIKVQVPKKIAEFMEKLTKEGYFNSKEDFARCSIEIIAQLYGLSETISGGKSLLDVLVDNGKATKTATTMTMSKPVQKPAVETSAQMAQKQSSELSPEELDIIDLFVGTKFEYEDALHAKYTMELMKMAKAPLPKDQFIEKLEGLAEKGNIERSEHRGKIVWKILERY